MSASSQVHTYDRYRRKEWWSGQEVRVDRKGSAISIVERVPLPESLIRIFILLNTRGYRGRQAAIPTGRFGPVEHLAEQRRMTTLWIDDLSNGRAREHAQDVVHIHEFGRAPEIAR